MSFDVLVIPEDPKWNGYILKPLAKKLMENAGKPKAKIDVLAEPRLRGYAHALRAIREELPYSRRNLYRLWLFFPDDDNRRGRADAMRRLEADLQSKGIPLLCCPAKPEVEIYACVGFRDGLLGGWEDARRHPRMKEEVFEPLRVKLKDRGPGGGRDQMITRSLQNLQLLFQLCPELKDLRDRIAAHLQTL